ncbi:Zn(2)-Cys(6) binuclear cluster domain-containing protein [Mycena vitilis]|nr:Zn(2)-Cys(6) binuclear cluster domain-containing protein [Mycena vitilis]
MDCQVSFAGNSMIPLQKGKACVNCRRRKIKCDGNRPICQQCAKFLTAFGDCEYTENGPAYGKMLEEQIAILQTRIEDLERPPQTRLSVSLSPLPLLAGRENPGPTLPVSPTNGMRLGPLLSHFYSQQTLAEATGAKLMPTELPYIVLQALVHNFIHKACLFGFFLDTQAFHNSILGSNSRHLPPVLLNVMYLWGVHLSKDPRVTAYEPAFLAHALRSTAGSHSGDHPRIILHSMQASVLLAYYFIRNARFVEGKYHISAAVSMAVCSGLHRIRAPQPQGTLEASPIVNALSPPQGPTEEGERISAFWNVLTLNNCWAVVDGAPSNVSYAASGLKIDTPWPLDSHDYVERPHLLPLQSSQTVIRFLKDVPDNAMSEAALHCKASILFEEGTRLGALYRPDGHPVDDAELRSVDARIDSFAATLPPIRSKHLLVAHTLCHGATVRLHGASAKIREESRVKQLLAANAIVDILRQTDVAKVGLIDPVLAPLWTSASLVFISEIGQLHDSQDFTKRQVLTESLNIVIAAMENFAPHCRLMSESSSCFSSS